MPSRPRRSPVSTDPGTDPGPGVDDASPGSAEGAAANGRRGPALARRRARQEQIVASTRRLFDQRGMRSANIDDIARAVGVNRAIIYRHFASKEDLFALTLSDYLTEVDARLAAVDDPAWPPRERLAAVSREFAAYCLRHPAFVDCALSLLGRSGGDLLEEISSSTISHLATLMGGELGRISQIVRSGSQLDPFQADLMANALYMQTLGVVHAARSGFIMRSSAGEQPWAPVADTQILELVSRMAIAVAFPPVVDDAASASA